MFVAIIAAVEQFHTLSSLIQEIKVAEKETKSKLFDWIGFAWPLWVLLAVFPPFFPSPQPVLPLDHNPHRTLSTCEVIINNPQLLIMRWQQRAINQRPANEFQQILPVCVWKEKSGVVEMEEASLLVSPRLPLYFRLLCSPPHGERRGMNEQSVHRLCAAISVWK